MAVSGRAYSDAWPECGDRSSSGRRNVLRRGAPLRLMKHMAVSSELQTYFCYAINVSSIAIIYVCMTLSDLETICVGCRGHRVAFWMRRCATS
jgi:hypothetical protein